MKVQEHDLGTPTVVMPFANEQDHEICRKLHKKFGTSYYFATKRFRREIRRRVHALYGFVRVPDEWVDNPGPLSREDQVALLANYRSELLRGVDGVQPNDPVLRAFCDVLREVHIPTEEPLIFLQAMESDLTTDRYETYGDLKFYMRGSASAVGVMMCYVLGADTSSSVLDPAMALGEAMQLTNFLRDVGEDADRGRIYLPLEDLASFAVKEEDVLAKRLTDPFIQLMKFEIARARALYAQAATGIPLLPHEARNAVQLSLALYSAILGKIEKQSYDVFSSRARTNKFEKLWIAMKTLAGR